MLPVITDCNYFKRSLLTFDNKTEYALIFNLKKEENYNFVFRCPKCGHNNEYKELLNVKKVRENGKNKEIISFYCKKCNNEYRLEKQKKMMGLGKSK